MSAIDDAKIVEIVKNVLKPLNLASKRNGVTKETSKKACLIIYENRDAILKMGYGQWTEAKTTKRPTSTANYFLVQFGYKLVKFKSINGNPLYKVEKIPPKIKDVRSDIGAIELKKEYIGKFNATHTAFDVLTDYAFGGDKQSALEYLKSM